MGGLLAKCKAAGEALYIGMSHFACTRIMASLHTLAVRAIGMAPPSGLQAAQAALRRTSGRSGASACAG